MKFYIIKNGKPVETTDLLEWSEWFHNSERRVRQTKLRSDERDETMDISTIFLGINHHTWEDKPYIWEQAIFHADGEVDITASQTLENAKESHQTVVDLYLSGHGWKVVEDNKFM